MNTNAIHHEGKKTFKLANTINTPNVFGLLIGDHLDLSGNGALNRPTCIIQDTGHKNDYVQAHILGSNASTMQVLANSQIHPGEMITADSFSHAVSINSLSSGTYHICGIAVSHAAPGELLEFTPTLGFTQTINK